MDAWWPKLIHAMFDPTLTLELYQQIPLAFDDAPSSHVGSSYIAGWYGNRGLLFVLTVTVAVDPVGTRRDPGLHEVQVLLREPADLPAGGRGQQPPSPGLRLPNPQVNGSVAKLLASDPWGRSVMSNGCPHGCRWSRRTRPWPMLSTGPSSAASGSR